LILEGVIDLLEMFFHITNLQPFFQLEQLYPLLPSIIFPSHRGHLPKAILLKEVANPIVLSFFNISLALNLSPFFFLKPFIILVSFLFNKSLTLEDVIDFLAIVFHITNPQPFFQLEHP